MRPDYQAFIAGKAPLVKPAGFEVAIDGAHLWPWQAAVVSWACRQGRAALLADTGLGKSRMELEWARQVHRQTGRQVLLLTPLAVGEQMVREAARCGMGEVALARAHAASHAPVLVANYERLHLFHPDAFAGVVLDESSILKSFMGRTKRRLIEAFARTPYRLAATATPAPNDHLELGNHAEFLGVMSSHQMIARWFINDAKEAGAYRLKGHAAQDYWDWVTSWARCIGQPSDLGEQYSDEGYRLPPLDVRYHTVAVDLAQDRGEHLFRVVDTSATALHRERRRTAAARAEAVAELVGAEPTEPWVVWVETNTDADAVCARIPGALEVRGTDDADVKTERLLAFSDGQVRVLVTKPSIAGFGLNWQHCARTAFAGPSYSYEAYYQAVRRFWRFGQTRPVQAHLVMAATEQAVWSTLERKAAAHEAMKAAMFAASRRAQARSAPPDPYCPRVRARLPRWLTSEAA